MSMFRAEQAPLPTPPAREEPGDAEGVKFETTAKGPRWTIKVRRDQCIDDAHMVNRIESIDRMMRQKFGEPT